MAITRTAVTDDSGSGTDGTIFNNAWLTSLYDQIDALFTTGTWTPVLTFGGAAVGMTYGTQTGTWSRFGLGAGSIFVVEMRLVLTAKGSSTGAATITGLPLAGNLFPACIMDCVTGMVGLTGTPFGTFAGSTITPVQTSATGRTQLTEAHFSNTSDLRLGLTYRV